MEYTQGEWKVFEDNGKIGFHTVNIDAKTRICAVESGLANAKLIAAAPNMYDALMNAPILSKYNDAEKFIEAYEKWRDEIKLHAIKKATE
jgi:hypothetical protein